MRRKTLLEYAVDDRAAMGDGPLVVLYSRSGPSGVYALSDRDRRRALFSRHAAEHGCGTGDVKSPSYVGGFMNCPEASRLFGALDERDSVVLA
jgi:hypothetical protein